MDAADVPGAVGRDVLRAGIPVAAGAAVVYAAVTDPAHPARVAALAAAAGSLAVWAVRPRLPAAALTVGVLAAVVVAKSSGDLDVGLFVVSLLAIAVAGWESSRAVVLGACAAAAATPLVCNLVHPDDVDAGVWVLAIVFPGLMSGLFRRQEQLRAELEASRRRELSRAVGEERRRIARDVHDLVGHGLSAMMLQVAGARHVLRRDPDEADAALVAAEDAGRRSLGELRSTVALLRGDGDDPVSAVPGLARLLSDPGVEVRATGDVERVDPMVGLTLYRIAQEALLNAARHAPAARTTVAVDVGADRVELRVRSAPASAGPGRPGYGLIGMRERAAAVGGELTAGPDAGGWLVRCTAPLTTRALT